VRFWGFLSQIVAGNAILVKYLKRKFKKQWIKWPLTSLKKKKEPNNVSSAGKVIDSAGMKNELCFLYKFLPGRQR
jgi:hypothetical protein